MGIHHSKSHSERLNATRASCKKLCHSSSVWVEVLQSLSEREQIEMQLANHFLYDIALSRAQTCVHVPHPIYFAWGDGYEQDVFKLDAQKQLHLTKAVESHLDFEEGYYTVQSGNQVVFFSQNGDGQSPHDFESRGMEAAGVKIHRTGAAAALTHRAAPSICTFVEEFIFFSGGFDPDTLEPIDSVDIYDVHTDRWPTKAPCLNQARASHSSCALGNMLYVLCGRQKNRLLNSIECIDAQQLVTQNKTCPAPQWTLIEIDPTVFKPRVYELVAPLNSQELVILGGQGQDGSDLGDVCVFDTQSWTVRCELETKDGGFRFEGPNNQCAETRKNQVAALVQQDGFLGKLFLVSYTKGDDRVQVIEEITNH